MRILLAGDSWGAKPNLGRTLFSKRKNDGSFASSHKGLEEHMVSDGHSVVNVSGSGSSNTQIIEKIKLKIQQGNFDYILFIQTDPLRDEVNCKFNLGFSEHLNKKWFETYEDLLEIRKYHLNKAYKKLSNIGETIHIVGGCSKVDKTLISSYNNLVCVIESIPELLVKDYIMPDIWGMNLWQKKIDDRWDLDVLDKLLEQLKMTEWLHDNSPYFYIDPMHPDSEGYKKVYECIKEKLGL